MFEYLWNLDWWQNETCVSLKKISQLKSNIRSCRCKNFSLKQASGLIWGSGPPEPSPWIRHRINANKLLIMAQPIRNLQMPGSAELNKRGFL